MGDFAEGLVGVTLDDRYRLDAVLGEGGMGAVFRATHLAMDRKVAIKLLKPHLSGDEAMLHRFAREARNALKVDSEHAVKVVDYGVTPLFDYYMVLEYLDGRTVQRELEIDGAFSPARVVHIARQVLHALGAAHRIGLVHRDIKPDNILLLKQGDDPDYAKVLDFGVSKLMEGSAKSSRSALKLTQAGVVFGTPEFMSPEQACGLALDGRSDLYSLAATMYAMLTGTALFEAGSAIELLTHHARTPPPHLPPELPARLDAMLQKCLAKHREIRFASAEELDAELAQLEPLLRGERPPTGPVPKPALFSPSTYVEALDESNLDLETPPQSRRGLYLAIGGIAVAAMLAVAIAVALAKRGKPADELRIAAPSDAAIARADAGLVDAAVSVDAPLDAGPKHVVVPPLLPPPPHVVNNAELDQHLADFADAKRTGNVLKELAAAQLAFKADPHSTRARLAFAEALIATQNNAEACKQLIQLPVSQAVTALRRSAGCGSD